MTYPHWLHFFQRPYPSANMILLMGSSPILVSLDAARRRYEKWAHDPEKIAWHACKRIFTYALMLSHGMTNEEIITYLLDCPWFHDYRKFIFRCEPTNFIQSLIKETLRARAAEWCNERLMPLTPYRIPEPHWIHGPARIADWPKA